MNDLRCCPGDIALDGDPAPPPQKGHSSAPLIGPCLYCGLCGQTAGWIKVPLGTEVGLGPSHTVSDGDPAPPKGSQARSFRSMSVVAKRLDQDAT